MGNSVFTLFEKLITTISIDHLQHKPIKHRNLPTQDTSDLLRRSRKTFRSSEILLQSIPLRNLASILIAAVILAIRICGAMSLYEHTKSRRVRARNND